MSRYSKNNKKRIHNPDDYGIPELKKYLLNDEYHLKLTIKYFDNVKKSYRKELAKNIFRKVKEFNLSLDYVFSQSNELIIYYYNNINDKKFTDKKYEDNFNSFYISDNNYFIDNNEKIFSKTIEEAILFYLENNKARINCMDKIKKQVYSYNYKNKKFNLLNLGLITIFIYNNYTEFDWSWNIENKKINNGLSTPIKNNFDIQRNKNQYIINDYKRKIIGMGKENHMMLVPRLYFDSYNSLYSKFNERDKVKNKVNLSKHISNDTYVLSDLHFGKYTKEDDKTIIKFINTTIKEDDILLILGDIGFMNNLNKNYLQSCIKRINCKNLFLVLGNHDIFTLDFYYKCGFLSIYERFYYKNKNDRFIFSHQPCNSEFDTDINFHGHLHNSSKYHESILNTNNKINCYYNKYLKPMKIGELINIFTKDKI